MEKEELSKFNHNLDQKYKIRSKSGLTQRIVG